MARPKSEALPQPGTVVVDTARDLVGVFQTFIEKAAWLRPVGGGCEWTVDPQYLRPATRDEELRAKNAARNAQSREAWR